MEEEEGKGRSVQEEGPAKQYVGLIPKTAAIMAATFTGCLALLLASC